MRLSDADWQKKNYIILLVLSGLTLVTFIFIFFMGTYFLDFCRNKIASPNKDFAVLPATSVGEDVGGAGSAGKEGVTVSNEDPEVGGIVKQASKHIFLPNGKVVVTTITDIDSLRQQDPIFYLYASNGDKILFYEERAILYSPKLDRVIDIAHRIAPTSTSSN